MLCKIFRIKFIAKIVGDKFPTLRDRVINAIQVFRESPENPFAQIELRIISEEVLKEPLTDAIDYRDSKKMIVIMPYIRSTIQ